MIVGVHSLIFATRWEMCLKLRIENPIWNCRHLEIRDERTRKEAKIY